MKDKTLILNFINKQPKGKLFCINDIFEMVIKEKNIDKNNEKLIKKEKNNIKAILYNLRQQHIIKTLYNGFYYVPEYNVLGEMIPAKIDIIYYKYIIDENKNIFGYFTGATLFNRVGLCTLVPNKYFIVTNKYTNKNKYFNKNLNVILEKPKIKIDNDNYLYLQLIEILENKENIFIDNKNPNKIIYNYIKNYNLDFEKILYYIKILKNKKALCKLMEIVN